MANNIVRVRQEFINYGNWENLDVAIAVEDKKDLYVTYPTAEIILNYRANSLREKIASKSLKTFLDKDLVTGKTTGSIVNKLGTGTPKVTLILFDDFLAVATWEACINQNVDIAKTLASGFGDSFRSIVFEQLGEKLELEDRQAWLIERQDSKDAFWEIGKAIKAYKERHPELSSDRKQWLYSNVQNNINRGLFGKAAKTIREELGAKDLLRDSYGRKSLRRIDHIQSLAASLIEEEDIEPCLAVQQALESFKYRVIGYCE